MSDPKRALGGNNTPGYSPYTGLGGSLKSATTRQEQINPDSRRIYTGRISNIILPVDSATIEDSGATGVRVQIRFNNNSINKTYSQRWFYLKKDSSELVMNYGTKESILRKNLSVNLLVRGIAFDNAIVEIVGPLSNENRYSRYTETPIMAWGDLFNGLRSGGAAS